MKKMMKNEKGFTLIELIIVIAILAIIAAVAIPNILGAVDNSRKSTDVANGKIILNAAAQVNVKNEEVRPVAGTDYVFTSSTTITPSDTFSAQLLLELNNALPIPKYKGATAANFAAFTLNVAADGTMTVTATTTGGANPTAVAPTPSTTVYDQN